MNCGITGGLFDSTFLASTGAVGAGPWMRVFLASKEGVVFVRSCASIGTAEFPYAHP